MKSWSQWWEKKLSQHTILSKQSAATLCWIWWILSWFVKKTDREVTLFYLSAFGGVWCGFESDTLTWVSTLLNKYLSGWITATNHTPCIVIEIHQNTECFSNVVNPRRKNVECFICIKTSCNKLRLEAHYQQYHPISMNEGLLPNRILPPAGWDYPEPSWFDSSRCS